MTWHWPFRRQIRERVIALEDRIGRTETRQEHEKEEIVAVQDRLRLLEVQADVITRTHLQPRP